MKKSKPKPEKTIPIPKVEVLSIDSLKPHPRNYRKHPEDQMAHIVASIRKNGCYRNIVIASDATILAGHGVVEGCKEIGLKEVPCIRLPWGPNDPASLKVLAGDNEISRLAIIDDRVLSDMLKEINDQCQDLIGTGFDPMQLANLVMVTRHSEEIADIDEASQWVGLPLHEPVEAPMKLIISFEHEDVRNDFLKRLKVKNLSKASGKTLSMWWPQREREDLKSVEFKGKK